MKFFLLHRFWCNFIWLAIGVCHALSKKVANSTPIWSIFGSQKGPQNGPIDGPVYTSILESQVPGSIRLCNVDWISQASRIASDFTRKSAPVSRELFRLKTQKFDLQKTGHFWGFFGPFSRPQKHNGLSTPFSGALNWLWFLASLGQKQAFHACSSLPGPEMTPLVRLFYEWPPQIWPKSHPRMGFSTG